MKIKDHDLRQLNEARLQMLLDSNPDALLRLTNRLLDDLKEARERLNQNPSNSSRPSGSQDPWFRNGDGDTKEEDNDDGDIGRPPPQGALAYVFGRRPTREIYSNALPEDFPERSPRFVRPN